MAALAAEAASQDPALRDALDAILEKLEAVPQAQQALATVPGERDTFIAVPTEELQWLGDLSRFEVVLGGANVSAGRDTRDSVIVIGTNTQVTVERGGGPGRRKSDVRAAAVARARSAGQRAWQQRGRQPRGPADRRRSSRSTCTASLTLGVTTWSRVLSVARLRWPLLNRSAPVTANSLVAWRCGPPDGPRKNRSR